MYAHASPAALPFCKLVKCLSSTFVGIGEQTLIMGIQRPDGGRVTVLDDALKIYKSNGDVEERTLQTPEEFQAAMQEHFGIGPITS